MPESVQPGAAPGPRVSALILACNQAAATRQTVAALETSTPREALEIIVLDCASQDGTATLDGEFPALQMLRLPHHLGAARALNIGVRTARGEFVLFLAPGVEVAPDTLAQLVAAMDAAASDVAAVCPRLREPSGAPASHIYRLPEPGARSYTAAPAGAGPVELATLDALLVRRQFMQAMNYFDQRYGHAWVDAELAMQMRRAGKKILLHPTATAVRHPAPDPLAGKTVAVADRLLGASAYAGKYGGPGFRLRWGAALRALLRFELGLFTALVSGQKLDGTQSR